MWQSDLKKTSFWSNQSLLHYKTLQLKAPDLNSERPGCQSRKWKGHEIGVWGWGSISTRKRILWQEARTRAQGDWKGLEGTRETFRKIAWLYSVHAPACWNGVCSWQNIHEWWNWTATDLSQSMLIFSRFAFEAPRPGEFRYNETLRPHESFNVHLDDGGRPCIELGTLGESLWPWDTASFIRYK